MRLSSAILALTIPFFLATASAGTAEAPELTDPAGDCAFAPANEYADVIAAWISDETATHFNVNLAINKWIADPAAELTGYTVQFEHQGKQFGIAAFYGMGAWEFSNAFVDPETGEADGFSEAQGTFVAGEPALITVAFDKSHFPHEDMSDNQLRSFQAATADFKPFAPFWFVPAELPAYPPFVGACDMAESSATYTFAVGGHASHASGNETESADTVEADAGSTNVTAEQPEGVAAAATTGENDTPLPAALAGLALAAAAVALRRR